MLSFPGVNALRPTPDAVRETVFNWLMPYIVGRRCLDLYAGSGALGFEAVSRGAQSVVLVEKNPRTVKALRQNQAAIDSENQVSVSCCSAMQFLSTVSGNYELIFLDPPYASDELEKACYQLNRKALLAPDGLVYLEYAANREKPLLPGGWREIKSAQRGDVRYGLYLNETDLA